MSTRITFGPGDLGKPDDPQQQVIESVDDAMRDVATVIEAISDSCADSDADIDTVHTACGDLIVAADDLLTACISSGLGNQKTSRLFRSVENLKVIARERIERDMEIPA